MQTSQDVERPKRHKMLSRGYGKYWPQAGPPPEPCHQPLPGGSCCWVPPVCHGLGIVFLVRKFQPEPQLGLGEAEGKKRYGEMHGCLFGQVN